MYIVKVLIEHPVMALDTTFDYLSYEDVSIGVRVIVSFRNKKIVGYVEKVEYTSLTKEQLEKQAGFHYQHILSVIDTKPLLNQELQELAIQLSKMTLSPRIACLQAMLPTQLKPSSSKGVSIKTKKIVEVLQDGNPKTYKQKECLKFLIKNQHLAIKDIPYSKSVLDQLEKQGYIAYQEVEDYRNP